MGTLPTASDMSFAQPMGRGRGENDGEKHVRFRIAIP
jgi:hypothetical protein